MFARRLVDAAQAGHLQARTVGNRVVRGVYEARRDTLELRLCWYEERARRRVVREAGHAAEAAVLAGKVSSRDR